MLLISPGSHAYKIITILLITGEFPFRSLGLIGNERMFKEAAVRMTKHQNVRIKGKDKSYRCKIITISGKSTRKTIRLCRSCFPLIEEEFPKTQTINDEKIIQCMITILISPITKIRLKI